MTILHDRSYIYPIDQELIARGYAVERLDSLNLSFQYTEAERAENHRQIETCAPEQWTALRIRAMTERSETVHTVVEAISKEFVCYQYGENTRGRLRYDDTGWDLFFWCNNFLNTMGDTQFVGNDYSNTRLSFNERHDMDRHQQIYDRVLKIIKEHFQDHPNLHLRVQYKAQKDEAKIETAAKGILPQLLGKPCRYHGMSGKLIQTDRGIFFMKKYAKTRGYKLSTTTLLRLWWEQFDHTGRKEVRHG